MRLNGRNVTKCSTAHAWYTLNRSHRWYQTFSDTAPAQAPCAFCIHSLQNSRTLSEDSGVVQSGRSATYPLLALSEIPLFIEVRDKPDRPRKLLVETTLKNSLWHGWSGLLNDEEPVLALLAILLVFPFFSGFAGDGFHSRDIVRTA